MIPDLKKPRIAMLFIAIITILIAATAFFVFRAEKPIKIVASFPMRGASVGPDIVNGIRLALEEGEYKVNGRKIDLVVEDDGNEAGAWSAAREWEISTRAAKDDEVLLYMGPFNSGAAKVSIPVTNEAGLPQLSPGNTWPGLTKSGFAPGEPDAFYPTRVRSYFRNCPTDALQGPAAATWAKELGFKKVYIFDDGQAYGKGIADLFHKEADRLGITIHGHQTMNTLTQDISENIEDIKNSGVDLIYFGGITSSGAVPLLAAMDKAGVKVGFMGSDGLMEQVFVDLAGKTAEGAYITQVGVPSSQMVGKGRDFVMKYKARYGTDPGTYSGFGYEAMKVAMDAISRAGRKDRAGILTALSETKDYDGLFGKWSFDENGDTSLSLVSGNKIEEGKFIFQKLITGE